MEDMFPPRIQISLTVLAVIIFVTAVIGNCLVIYIVFTVNHMRNSTNTLIANLAFADLLMAVDLPYILKWAFLYDQWFGTFMGDALCKFFHSAQAGSVACSVFSLLAISLDRSFAILFPMKTIMTRKVVRGVILLTWLGALALMLPIMIVVRTQQQQGTDNIVCIEYWEGMSRQAYHVALFIASYAIPLALILIVYTLAGLRLWNRKLPGHRNLLAQKKAQASSKRATIMLITVVVIFALSWLPWQSIEMIVIYNFALLKKTPLEWHILLPWLGYANSAVNPILYVIFSENYRHEFRRILCRGPSRRDRYRRSTVGSRSTTRMTRVSRGSSSNVIPLHRLKEDTNGNKEAESP